MPGRIFDGLPEYDGLRVFDANAPIIELVKSRGALMGQAEIYHSYPHCWRCHHPIIFRATEQWFINMDTPMKREDGSPTTFRQYALDEIEQVTWDPAWGKERISNMVQSRPDWCISRQRIWGVPIAVLSCTQCGKLVEDAALNKRIVALFEREGADAWYTHEVGELHSNGNRLREVRRGRVRERDGHRRCLVRVGMQLECGAATG